MKTQEIHRPQQRGLASRATMPATRRDGRRAEPPMHLSAALLGVFCVAGVFGLLWLLFNFG